jgi:hypothetical protein
VYSVTTDPVDLETDCLEIVSLWNMRATQRSEITPVLRDIQELSASFSSFYVVHARRTSNNAAHVCAKVAASIEFDVWANDPQLSSANLAR